MPYSADVVRQARQQLAQQKEDKASVYRQRLFEAYAKVPRLKQIDLELRRTMTQAAQTVFTQGGDPVAAMEQIRQGNQKLQQERQALVDQNFAPGYLDDSPICSHCGGSGYVGSTMCRCLAVLCQQAQRKQISSLLTGGERFDAFRLDYYPDRIDHNYGVSPRHIMEKNLNACKRYADAFCQGIGNLLFVGNPGLGKTFLSACIADVVTVKGYSVAYESAPQLFAKLEKNRFNPDEQSRAEAERFAGCDLLIIDDLGTEMPSSFVTAALYSLVNDRLLANKSMIISTNLVVEELAKRYSPQIASRIGGGFKTLAFVGEDIRMMKNRGI